MQRTRSAQNSSPITSHALPRALKTPFNAHRSVLPSEVLDESFTWQETRKLSQSLTFNYQRHLFMIRPLQPGPASDAPACVLRDENGRFEVI
jgi:hypothetical protein